MKSMSKNDSFYLTNEFIDGKKIMKDSTVSICSIVRDCGSNLKRNIPRIEHLRSFFKESEVIIFENDSIDSTKEILIDWAKRSANVHVFTENLGSTTIPSRKSLTGNPYYSISRIEKMAKYRNKYIQFLIPDQISRDFVVIIDLDISDFDIDGIIHSFGTNIEWDCITANGTSVSSKFKRQYHDAYALIEFGKLKLVQTEQSIKLNRSLYSFLKKGMPLFHVDSAYGGLAIYKWKSMKDIYYSYVLNNDGRVQCKNEHVGFHKAMIEKGYNKIFINPSMQVKYRSITFQFLLTKLIEKLNVKSLS